MFKSLDEMREAFPEEAESFREVEPSDYNSAEEFEAKQDGFVKKTVMGPEEATESLILEQRHFKREMDMTAELIMFSQRLASDGSDSGYGLNDEGSGYLTETFQSLLWYAIGERAQELRNLIHEFAVENIPKRESSTTGFQPPRYSEWWNKSELLMKELAEFDIFRGRSVLDIGCGRRGDFIRFVSELGANATGIDIQIKDNDDIVKHGDIRDMENLPKGVKQESFDFVIATMTFNLEVKTTNGCFGNALRLVKPGGYIIISPRPYMEPGSIEEFDVIEDDRRTSNRLVLRKKLPDQTDPAMGTQGE